MATNNKRWLRMGSAAAIGVLLTACGGGTGGNGAEGSSRAQGSEAAAPSMRILAATSSLPVRIANEPDPLLQGLAIPADAPSRGMWSGTVPWPMNAIHAALLPNGKVLTYGTPQGQPGAQDGRTLDVWTPALGTGPASHATSFEAGRNNSFCGTAGWQADGRLMLIGGNSPNNASLFTPENGQTVGDRFTVADQRWYATLLALPDGRSVILGGMDPYSEGMEGAPDAAIANGSVSMTPEIYTPGTGWRTLPRASSRDAFGPDFLRASYPRAWVAPNGLVFGLSADTMWWLDVNANAGAGATTVAGRFKTPYSSTAPVNVGSTNTAVMYAPGKVLVVGGNGGFNGDGRPASNMATSIDINSGVPVLTEAPRMTFARRMANSVVLPDGKVLVTGGTRVGNNGGADAVFAAELWNPASNTWALGASAAQIRVYHSTTLLLPNGTVLSAGGGAPGPVDNLNAEIYYPPYLFRSVNGAAQLAPRPVVTGISALRFTPGEAITLEMTDATAMARVVLVANGSVTHAFNTTQRHVPLEMRQVGDRITATLPANANLLPPGYYQLFVLDAQGVPSRAVIVSIGVKAPTATPVLARGQALAFDSLATPGSAIGVDAGGLAVLQPASTASTPASARFVVRDGLANASCVSLELAAAPGQFLRHAGFRVMRGAPDGSELFRQDATFCPEAGASGSGISLRSLNYPTHLLRARNGEVWIDPQAGDAAFAASASWAPRDPATAVALPTIGAVAAAPLVRGSVASFNPGLDGPGLSFSWSYGDGTPATPFSASSATSHTYAQPGLYLVTLTVRASDGRSTSKSFLQSVVAPPTANAPQSSSDVFMERRTNASARLWVVNGDNDSVSVIDTASNARVGEIATGSAPRAIARAADGNLWVVNHDGASISVVSPTTLAVLRTLALPRASQPWGLVVGADGSAYLSLQASGQVLKMNSSTGAVLATLATGPTPRHLALTADGTRLLVSRFITPALLGEGTATVNTSGAGGEVLVVNTATMAVQATVRLAHSDRTDTEIQGSGIPNYLGAPAISPDGATAWVPSKQDNIKRGTLRNAQALNFQSTVRAISARIELATLAENAAARLDHDNASLASAATHDPSGAYLFVALETSRRVDVHSAITGALLFSVDVGLAPRGLVAAPDGRRLYVHNALSRSVSVLDISPLTANGETRASLVATAGTVASEKLPAAVLRGKQLFHDARDPRLSRDSYMSCASCHNEGGHDGRTWDFTHLGEGLRNTPSLRGRAGMGQGLLHWSANFDEVQDFEGQIRALAGGTGLLSDAQFNTGTRNQPLGDRKAGLSADLDALAAYVASLATVDRSPLRNGDGTLTAAAAAGRQVFIAANCASCHGGAGFTNSSDGSGLRNIGTLKPSSGKRLGGTLTGIDIPTLRDVWATAPYLHDGSAPTLAAAVQAHAGVTVSATDLPNLVAYLQQIGSEEAAAPGSPAPTPGTGTGLRGIYFGNATLSGTPLLSRVELPVFNWGTAAPAPGVPADNFSVRWAGEVQALEAGSYQFRTVSDDGVRVTVNGVRVIDNWTVHAATVDTSAPITLAAGQRVSIVIEYQEFGGDAVLQLSWLRPGGSWAAVPAAQLYPAAAPVTGGTGSSAPPANAVACASENGSCTLPAGATATVWYGANASWAVRTGVTGSIACNNATFGDPLVGTVKSCRYLVTSSTPVNLAPTATLATSYVSPWETLAAVNNGITPANSADKTGGAYGNWQGEALYGRTDWVSFSWPTPRTLSAVEVYWWNDGLGIATPTSARVEAWNGSAWVALGTPGLALNTFNRLNFPAVTTTSLRVAMAGTRATGILEARVWGTGP